jgi:hypothetical protein
MHLEILTEDASGAALIESLLPKLVGPNGAEHSWRLIPFRGIGHLPKNLGRAPSPRSRAILSTLPAIMRAYGKMSAPDQRVMVVVDNDQKDCAAFKRELLAVLDACDPPPRALFRIAVQEIEAWMLGDPAAILAAYPKANEKRLAALQGDAIDGEWETLAEAIRPGDAKALRSRGYPEIGIRKKEWAERIGPCIDPERNRSESFKAFAQGVAKLITD